MNKKSALVKRAAIIAAAVLALTVAIILPGYCLLISARTQSDDLTRLLGAARALSDAATEYVAGDSAPLEAAIGALATQYSQRGLKCVIIDRTGEIPENSGLPDSDTARKFIAAAYQGREDTAVMKNDQGAGSVAALIPIWSDGAVAGALVLHARTAGIGSYIWPLVFFTILALALDAILVYVLLQKLIQPVSEPIRRLRDVAVKVAGGDFDAHADESLPGELGELGLALNNLSNQLSRNMYMLIVERNRLKHMLYGLSEGIIAVGAQGQITHRNPALDRMFGQMRKDDVVNGRMRAIPDATIWEDFDQVISSGGTITRNIEIRDMVLRLIITPIVDEIGANAGAVGLFSDITQLERLERTRRDYVANVSHEMRTPLTAMRALIEPLKEGMVTKEDARMRYYDIILREVMRLSRLINDLMELSRLQSGTLAVQAEEMELEELVMDVCDRYKTIAEDHSLSFVLNTDFSACPPVVANADRVEQMLVILLDNAIKYTLAGGKVSLAAVWDERRVILSVSDTGIGISDEDLPYVFDRFYKVDKAHSGMGSGLGLSIARELLKWMGEEIWVTSEQEKGSTFNFTIRRYLGNH